MTTYTTGDLYDTEYVLRITLTDLTTDHTDNYTAGHSPWTQITLYSVLYSIPSNGMEEY